MGERPGIWAGEGASSGREVPRWKASCERRLLVMGNEHQPWHSRTPITVGIYF